MQTVSLVAGSRRLFLASNYAVNLPTYLKCRHYLCIYGYSTRSLRQLMRSSRSSSSSSSSAAAAAATKPPFRNTTSSPHSLSSSHINTPTDDASEWQQSLRSSLLARDLSRSLTCLSSPLTLALCHDNSSEGGGGGGGDGCEQGGGDLMMMPHVLGEGNSSSAAAAQQHRMLGAKIDRRLDSTTADKLSESIDAILLSYSGSSSSNSKSKISSGGGGSGQIKLDHLSVYGRLLSSLPHLGLPYSTFPSVYHNILSLISSHNNQPATLTASKAKALQSKSIGRKGQEGRDGMTRDEAAALYNTLAGQDVDLSSCLVSADRIASFLANTIIMPSSRNHINSNSSNRSDNIAAESQMMSMDDANYFLKLVRQSSSTVSWNQLPKSIADRLIEPISAYRLGEMSSSGSFNIDNLTSGLCYLHYLRLPLSSLPSEAARLSVMQAAIDCLNELQLYRDSGMMPPDVFDSLAPSMLYFLTRRDLSSSSLSLDSESRAVFKMTIAKLYSSATLASIEALLNLWEKGGEIRGEGEGGHSEDNNSALGAGTEVRGIVEGSRERGGGSWENIDDDSRKAILSALVRISSSNINKSKSNNNINSNTSSISSGDGSSGMSLPISEAPLSLLRATQGMKISCVESEAEMEALVEFLTNASQRVLAQNWGPDINVLVGALDSICDILQRANYKFKSSSSSSSSSSNSSRLLSNLSIITTRILETDKADLISDAVHSLGQLSSPTSSISSTSTTSISPPALVHTDILSLLDNASFRTLLLTSAVSGLERTKNVAFIRLVHGLEKLGISIHDLTIAGNSTSSSEGGGASAALLDKDRERAIISRAASLRPSLSLSSNFFSKHNSNGGDGGGQMFQNVAGYSQLVEGRGKSFSSPSSSSSSSSSLLLSEGSSLDKQVEMLMKVKHVSELGLKVKYGSSRNKNKKQIAEQDTPKGLLTMLRDVDIMTLPQFIQVTNALGALRVDADLMPSFIFDKIIQRMSRDVSYLINSSSNNSNPKYAFSVLAGYFTCLYKMGVEWRDLDERFHAFLFRVLPSFDSSNSSSGGSSAHIAETSILMFSVGRMGLQFRGLSEDRQRILEGLILSSLLTDVAEDPTNRSSPSSKNTTSSSSLPSNPNPQALSMLLNGFGRVGLKYDIMPLRIKDELLRHIEASLRMISSILLPRVTNTSNSSSSNSNSNSDCNSNPNPNPPHLTNRVLTNSSMCQIVSASTRALSSIDFDCMDLSPDLQALLLECVVGLETTMYSDPLGVADIVYGLGTMNFRWWRLESRHQDALVNAFSEAYLSMSDQQICNSIQGFGRLQLPIDWASPAFCQTIFGACLKVMEADVEIVGNNNNSSNACLAWTSLFYGLRKMGCQWEQLDDEFVAAYTASYHKFAPRVMEPLAVSSHIYSMGAMKAVWFDLDDSLRSNIFMSLTRTLADMSSQQLSNTLSGLSAIQCNWPRLSTDLRRRLLSSIHQLLDDLVEAIHAKSARTHKSRSISSMKRDGFDEYDHNQAAAATEEEETATTKFQVPTQTQAYSNSINFNSSRPKQSINQLKTSFIFAVSAMSSMGYDCSAIDKELSATPGHFKEALRSTIDISRSYLSTNDETSLRKACRALKVPYPSSSSSSMTSNQPTR